MSKSNKALEDKDLLECIKEVNEKYLNKYFPGDPEGNDNKLKTKEGKIIYRPNSNVAHAARLPLYVPMVISGLKYNTTNSLEQAAYDRLNVARIQFTALYLSACKANEKGWRDRDNQEGVKNSIEAFKKAARSKTFFENEGKIDEAAISKYAEAMKNYGDPNAIIKNTSELHRIKRVLYITTQMDLSRCYSTEAMQIPLENCTKYLGKERAGKLFLCAAQCIKKTTGVFDQKTLNTYAKSAGREELKKMNTPQGGIDPEKLLEHTEKPEKILKAWQAVTADLKAHEMAQYHKNYVANDQFDEDGYYKKDNSGGSKFNMSSRTGLAREAQQKNPPNLENQMNKPDPASLIEKQQKQYLENLKYAQELLEEDPVEQQKLKYLKQQYEEDATKAWHNKWKDAPVPPECLGNQLSIVI
jgi:hypothetical protein